MRPLFAYLRAIVVPTSVFAAPEDWAAGTPASDGARAAGLPGLSDAGSSRLPDAGSSRLPDAGSRGLPDAGSPGSDGTGAPVGALADRITRAGRELAEQVALRERPPAADPFALSTSFERLLAGD